MEDSEVLKEGRMMRFRIRGRTRDRQNLRRINGTRMRPREPGVKLINHFMKELKTEERRRERRLMSIRFIPKRQIRNVSTKKYSPGL